MTADAALYAVVQRQVLALAAEVRGLKQQLAKREALIKKALGRLEVINGHKEQLESALAHAEQRAPLARRLWLRARVPLAICAVFRNEDDALAEWIEFHRLVGVERFYQ